MKNMFSILSERPAIGAASAFISSFIIATKDFLTDQGVLQVVQITGIWLGFMIAILTALLKLIELFREVRGK